MVKNCTNCKEEKKSDAFYKDGNSLRGECKDCSRLKKRLFYVDNSERLIKTSNAYYDLNKKSVQAQQKSYYEINKKKIQQYRKQRLKEDVEFKIACSLRNRLNRAVKGNYKSGSAVKNLGCSIKELKIYLESKFVPGMTWKNHGEWHIDHRIPLSNFDLIDINQLKNACHYTNLQPLWAKDNLIKGGKYGS